MVESHINRCINIYIHNIYVHIYTLYIHTIYIYTIYIYLTFKLPYSTRSPWLSGASLRYVEAYLTVESPETGGDPGGETSPSELLF
jgi:hypothetical protein